MSSNEDEALNGRIRGQLSLSLVEAAIGVVFILGVAVTFGLGVPAPETQTAQLDTYAGDATTVLENDPPRHAGQTRLTELTREQLVLENGDAKTGFDREKGALERRVDRILPANVLFRIEITGPETTRGSVGQARPHGIPVGYASVTTRHGEFELWVWYG